MTILPDSHVIYLTIMHHPIIYCIGFFVKTENYHNWQRTDGCDIISPTKQINKLLILTKQVMTGGAFLRIVVFGCSLLILYRNTWYHILINSSTLPIIVCYHICKPRMILNANFKAKNSIIGPVTFWGPMQHF